MKVVRGVGMVASGANSLASQKGRVSEANSNGSSSSSDKPMNPKKAVREAGKEQISLHQKTMLNTKLKS